MSVVDDLSSAMLTNHSNQFDDENDVKREMKRRDTTMTILTSKCIRDIHTAIKRYQSEAIWSLDRVVKEYIRSLLNDMYRNLYHDENNSVRMTTMTSRLFIIIRYSWRNSRSLNKITSSSRTLTERIATRIEEVIQNLKRLWDTSHWISIVSRWRNNREFELCSSVIVDLSSNFTKAAVLRDTIRVMCETDHRVQDCIDRRIQKVKYKKYLRTKRYAKVMSVNDFDENEIQRSQTHDLNVSKKKKIFDHNQFKFLIERRFEQYRRSLLTTDSSTFIEWIKKFSKMIECTIETKNQRKQTQLLFETWKNLFVKDVRNMSSIDLLEHHISTYANAISVIAKSILYTTKKIQWQKKNILALIETEIIASCQSSWSVKIRFSRKSNETLRMIHVFCQLNDVTIKSNYSMRRIEPILREATQDWLKHFFQVDVANEFWVIKTYRSHVYKLGFSAYNDHYCYLRMSQGITDGSRTYSLAIFEWVKK